MSARKEAASHAHQPELPCFSPPALPDITPPVSDPSPPLPIFDAATAPEGLFPGLEKQEIVTMANLRVVSPPEIKVIRRQRLRSGKVIETKEWLCRVQHPEFQNTNPHYNLLTLHATSHYEEAVKLRLKVHDTLTVSGRLSASPTPQGNGNELPVHDVYITALRLTKRAPKPTPTKPEAPPTLF